MAVSSIRRTADRIVPGGLADYVLTLRADDRSWRYISNRLEAEYGLIVSFQTLHDWFGDEEKAAS